MPSASVSKRRAREQAARLRAEQRRRDRRRKVITWTAIATAAAAAITAVGLSLSLKGASAAGIPGVRAYTGLARTHVTGAVTYPQQPPVGGPHSEVWVSCGIYAAPVPATEAVHSMEHGAVWITYRPGLPTAAVSQLRNLLRGEPARVRAYVLLSPYPGLPASVVASAWGKQLRLTAAADPRLARFISTYAQGPQTPEPGAACTGGAGTPMP